MKVLAVCLALALTYSYGAALPIQEDELFDQIQSFFVEPDQFVTALGFQRVKRHDNYDKEFNFDKLGVHVGIKYVDPSNRWKGGDLHVIIDNLQKLVPKAKSEKVDVIITLDGGDAPKDGLFNLKIKYSLNHSNLEEGLVTVERSFDGHCWVTHIKSESTNNAAVKLIPSFDTNLKSDRSTMLKGSHKSNRFDITINVDRTPGKETDAVITYNGQTITVNGQLDKAEKSLDIDVDVAGKEYKVNVDVDKDDKQRKVTANVDLGGTGSYQVEASLANDFQQAGLKVEFNGRALVSAKMKGKVDKAAHSAKFELRYTAVGFGEGKLRFGLVTKPDQELKLQYIPKNGLDFKLEASRESDGLARHWKLVATRADEVYSKYTLDLEPQSLADHYELNVNSHLKISEKSLFYDKFCTYGCFNERELVAKVWVDKAAKYKFSLDVDVTKDKENVFDVELSTKASPYRLRVTAPRLLPKITDDGRDTFSVEADHSPGQYLKLTSNSPRMRTFSIEKMDGDMRRVELNGKELVRGAFSKGGNQITQTTELPDGRALTTTIKWATEQMTANKVDVKLEGTERNFDGHVEWDVTDQTKMWAKAEGKGENKLVGPYEIKREMKIECPSDRHSVSTLTGLSKNKDYTVETDISADLDFEHKSFGGHIKKVVNGKSYVVILKDGSLSVEM